MNNPTIRLLILNDSTSEAERLVSMLNNAGRSTRAQHVDSEGALVKLLQSQSWDLLIGLDTTRNLTVADAIKTIRKVNKDVPVILLTSSEGSRPIVDGLKQGAADVVQLDEDQHLLQVMSRELANRSTRNKARFAERRYKEIEGRNETLLDSSRDGIAFVQDGMFIYTNESFANLLEYDDKDDLECMPIIDAVDESDQTELKRFMKEFMVKGSEIDSNSKTINFVSPNKSVKSVSTSITKANYDDELCIQFLVPGKSIKHLTQTNTAEPSKSVPRAEPSSPAAAVDSNIDPLTSLYNKNFLLKCLDRAVDNAVSGEHMGAVVCIVIQDFINTVQTQVGIQASDKVISLIAQFAKTIVQESHILCRFGDSSFMLVIPKTSTDDATKVVEQYCEKLSEHYVDIEGATLHLNFKAGIGLFSEMTTRADTSITHALTAIELLNTPENADKTVLAYEPEPEITTDGSAGLNKDEIHKILQKTIDHGAFDLLFQPILSLRGSDKEHYEIFIRLSDQKLSHIGTHSFFDVAQEHGLSTKIDRWVILETLKLLAKHRSNGHKTVVVINLTKDSILDTTLADWLGVAFKAAKLPPSAVIFQVNETVINNHINLAKEFAAKLKTIGGSCCVSHFGCALNPFKALQHVDVDYVKIDGSFTQELQANSGEPASLSEIVKQLHELDKITVVPFVESASVLSKLWQSGVHYIQGHYLQAPTTAMDYDFDSDN